MTFNAGSATVTLDGDSKSAEGAFKRVGEAMADFESRAKRVGDSVFRATSRVDELRLQQQLLTRALVEAAGAAERDEGKVHALRLELEQTTGMLSRLTGAQQVSVAVQQKIVAATTTAAASHRNMGGAVLEASRAFEDMQYGISGVLNNIPSLVMSLGGGMGLAGVLSLVLVAAAQVTKHWPDFGGAAETAIKNVTTSTADLRREIEDLDRELRSLQTGISTRRLEAAEDVKAAIDDASRKIATAIPGGRIRFDMLMQLTKGDSSLLPDYGSYNFATRDQYVSPAAFEAAKAAAEALDAATAKYGRMLAAEAEQNAQRETDNAIEQANRDEAAFQATGAKAEGIRAASEQQSRDLVYAVGFDAATQVVLGNAAAALVLSAQANEKIVSEFPDPGEPLFQLPPEGLKLTIDPDVLPAMGPLVSSLVPSESIAPVGMPTTNLSAFKTHFTLMDEMRDKLDAGASSLTGFIKGIDDTKKAATGLITGDEAMDLVMQGLGGTLSANSIASALAGGPVGAVAEAAISAMQAQVAAVTGAVSGIVGDARFASATSSMQEPLVAAMLLNMLPGGQLPAIGALVAAAGAFTWNLAQSTKSAERFRGAMSIVVDRMALALEPLFAGLLWVVGVFDAMAASVTPFFDAFANADIGEALFNVVQPLMWAFSGAAWAAGMVANAMLSAAAAALRIVPGQGEAADALLALRVDTDALGDAWTAAGEMTYEQAQAAGEAAAAQWDLTQQTNKLARSTENVPSWYRVPLAEYRAAGGTGGSGASGASNGGSQQVFNGPVTFVMQTPNISETVRKGLMRLRGTPVGGARRGNEDDSN